MKFKNITEVEEFLKVVDSCEGDVYLTSIYGDKINLKSKLSQYMGIAALVGKHGEEMELWADFKEDQNRLLNFLTDHPEITD